MGAEHNVGMRNLQHVLDDANRVCMDPDCELHNPEVIESDAERYTAKAFFLAGVNAMLHTLENPEITESHEDPLVAAHAHVSVRHELTPNWP